MLKPAPMLHVEVLLSQSHLLPVAEFFGNKGILHLTKDTGHEALVQSDNQKDQEILAKYRSLSERCSRLLDFFGIEKPKRPTHHGEGVHVIRDSSRVERILEKLENEADDIDAALSLLSNENERLEELNAQILPIRELDTDLTFLSSHSHMAKLLGKVPSNILQRLDKGLNDYNAMIVPLRVIGDSTVIMAFSSKAHEEVLRYALHSAFFSEIMLPEHLGGKPEDILNQIKVILDENNEGIEVLNEDKLDLLERRREKLIDTWFIIEDNRRTFEMISYFIKTREAYLVSGWLPAAELKMVEEALAEITSGTALITSAAPREEETSVPVKMENPPIIESFQLLTETYGTPQYNEHDPTFLLALSSIVMFGAMFADIGHGIVLFLGALATFLATKELKNQTIRRFTTIIALFGISAAVFGVLFGSVFGREDIIAPLWLSPMHSTMSLFTWSCTFGALLIVIGLVINLINLMNAKSWVGVLLDKSALAGIIFYLAFANLLWSASAGTLARLSVFHEISLVLPLFMIGLKPFAEAHFHSNHHTEGIGAMIIEALTEVCETIITFFSNTLSFIRIGAFAICHAGLCHTVYILAEDITKGGIAGWVIIIGGNLFVILFEGLIVLIQTVRLEFYEFFSKFYRAGGLAYRPFAIDNTD